jgi:hypothetical protein
LLAVSMRKRDGEVNPLCSVWRRSRAARSHSGRFP